MDLHAVRKDVFFDGRPVGFLAWVFGVVVFFWMSFHQNGLTQTWFARDYTVKAVGPIFNIFFNLDSMLANYTAARHRRTEDAYSEYRAPGKRPNHAAVVYAQRPDLVGDEVGEDIGPVQPAASFDEHAAGD